MLHLIKVPFESLPPDERDVAENVNETLNATYRELDHFGEAMQLFEAMSRTTDEQIKEHWHKFMYVPLRDGAVTIYNLKMLIDAVRGSFRNSPVFKTYIDFSCLREAENMFRSVVPSWDGMRHSVAHAGELFSSLEDFKKNALQNEAVIGGLSVSGSNSRVVHSYINGEFVNTHEGKLVTYRLSYETYQNLRQVIITLLTGFSETPVEKSKQRPISCRSGRPTGNASKRLS